MFLVSFLTKSFLLKKLTNDFKIGMLIANIIPPIPNNNPPEIITIKFQEDAILLS